MTAPRDPDRLIHAFLDEGLEELPDPVYDSVRARIEQTRQRAVIGPWRVSAMNRYLQYGLVAAAVVVIAVVAINLLPGSPAPGGDPSATPEASEAPASVEPSVEPTSSGGGSLPVGPHVMGDQWHGEDRVTVTIPAPGWFAPDAGSVTKDLGGGDSVTVVVLPGDYYRMPRNACDWQIDDPDLRETYWPENADGFVAYFGEQPYDTPGGSATRDFSAPVDVTVDGSHGQRITGLVPDYPGGDPNACDEQRFCTVQDRDGWGCLLPHSEPGSLDTLWVVDPPEGRNYYLVVAASYWPTTSSGLLEEVNTLVDSMTFYVE
jgi:hypothetical protein